MTHPSPALAPEDDTDFVRFWNEVLAPKFIRFRHILVDGLAQHSAAVFPELPVRPGDRLSVARTCLEARPSASRPQMGLCRFLYEVKNQTDTVVMSMTVTQLFGRRVAGAKEAGA